jgi:hypothetical protein
MDTPGKYGEKCMYITLEASWDLIVVDTDPSTKGWRVCGRRKSWSLGRGSAVSLVVLYSQDKKPNKDLY